MDQGSFNVRQWEESSLLVGLDREEKEELVQKLNSAVVFLTYKKDELKGYVRRSSLPMMRKIYEKIGNDFDPTEIIDEFNGEAWESVFNSKLEEVSNIEELEQARKDLVDDFVKTFS